MKTNRFICLLALGLTLNLANFALAQEEGDRVGRRQQGQGQEDQGQQGRQGQRGQQGGRRSATGPGQILQLTRQLELTDEQREQIQAIIKEAFPDFAARRDEAQQRDPEQQAKRKAAVEKFKAEGLEGQALREAVQKELGITPPTAEQRREMAQQRLRDRGEAMEESEDAAARRQEMQAKQQEVMQQIRDVLTAEQLELMQTKMKEQMEQRRSRGGQAGENGQGPGQRRRGPGRDGQQRDGQQRDGR